MTRASRIRSRRRWSRRRRELRDERAYTLLTVADVIANMTAVGRIMRATAITLPRLKPYAPTPMQFLGPCGIEHSRGYR